MNVFKEKGDKKAEKLLKSSTHKLFERKLVVEVLDKVTHSG